MPKCLEQGAMLWRQDDHLGLLRLSGRRDFGGWVAILHQEVRPDTFCTQRLSVFVETLLGSDDISGIKQDGRDMHQDDLSVNLARDVTRHCQRLSVTRIALKGNQDAVRHSTHTSL